MLRVSDAVREIVEGDPVLRAGLHHRLLNLSRVARFIQPLVEARTRKSVRPPAIAMSLSRQQRTLAGSALEAPRPFLATRINLHAGLAALALPKEPGTPAAIRTLLTDVQGRGGYWTVTEGVREVMVILEERHVDLAAAALAPRATRVRRDLTSLGVTLRDEDVERPGTLYRILEPLALQGINVAEVTSTTTEFHVYVHARDALLALESLYAAFGAR